MNDVRLKLIQNTLNNILENDLLYKSLSAEYSGVNLKPNLDANSLKEIFENYAIVALPLNNNLKKFDVERHLFEFDNDLSISDIKKDFQTENLENSFPIFNTKQYFKIFLEGNQINSKNEISHDFLSEKEEIWEKKPLKIELISKIQKNIGIRAKTPLILQETILILDNYISSNDTQIEESEIEIIEQDVKDLQGLCKDANYFLKKLAFEDFLGRKQEKLVDEYKSYLIECKN